MIALTPRMRVWVAAAPADFRGGIDGLARRVRRALAEDPFGGAATPRRHARSRSNNGCARGSIVAPPGAAVPGFDRAAGLSVVTRSIAGCSPRRTGARRRQGAACREPLGVDADPGPWCDQLPEHADRHCAAVSARAEARRPARWS